MIVYLALLNSGMIHQKSDRPSDEEIENLAGCLVKFNGSAFDEEELTDVRIAQDLKQRQLERLKKSQRKPKS